MSSSARRGSRRIGQSSGARHHVRNMNDENEVISFGFNGTLEELRRLRDESGREDERQRTMAELVESTGADGIYEVIEEVRPPGEGCEGRIICGRTARWLLATVLDGRRRCAEQPQGSRRVSPCATRRTSTGPVAVAEAETAAPSLLRPRIRRCQIRAR